MRLFSKETNGYSAAAHRTLKGLRRHTHFILTELYSPASSTTIKDSGVRSGSGGGISSSILGEVAVQITKI